MFMITGYCQKKGDMNYILYSATWTDQKYFQ